MKTEAELFFKLFEGGTHGFGLIDKTKATGYDYKHIPPSFEHYLAHLEGRLSLGIVPINRKGLTKFGVLDIDDHKKGGIKKDFDFNKLLKKIKFLKLPLTVCKSKSGGAHCYLLLDTFYKAIDVRHILKKMSYALGYERGSVEIFPKQDKLLPAESGSFINLPYKGGNSRVVLDFAGTELNAAEGLSYASKRVTNESNWSKFKVLDWDKSTGRNDRTMCATAFLKKHYDDWQDRVVEYNKIFNEPPIEDKELFQTVIKSNDKKDYFDEELEEAPPTELIDYDISDYRRLDIKEPKFITERLFKERSINFCFGEKGKGKTEVCLGMANAMVRGLPFLKYKNPIANPVLYADGEMDPFDIIERDNPYLETFGIPPKNFLKILNWHFQKDQKIPDIREKTGQDLILQRLQIQEKQTGKKPFLILDNLRSLSNYIENDSDSWRPIGLWLRDLRGLGYSSLVVDHTGKSSELGMRGTSSKSDWANICMQVIPEVEKGSRLMKMKIHFDKARGLKPDETEDFVAQYDFQGTWQIGQSIKEKEDAEYKEKIKVMLQQKVVPSQKEMAKELLISAGKVNKIIKEIKS